MSSLFYISAKFLAAASYMWSLII